MREDLIKRMQQGYKFGDSDVILEAVEEIESMRQQLAAALAACKVKDEALEEYLRNQAGDHTEEIAEAALAIQPDDSALKAWLGEPVGKVSGDRQAGMFSVVPHGTLLYAPKGMK